MTQEKIEEVIDEILGNFEVTDEPQHYQAYPCHITKFQNECIRERIRTEVTYLLDQHSAHLLERIESALEDYCIGGMYPPILDHKMMMGYIRAELADQAIKLLRQ
jgi:hypothetical protein